jgi:multidrug efflux pump subunit AcrB
MRLVLASLRRPVTVVLALIALALASALAIRRIPVDIFPQLGSPAIYVAQPYGGMDPSQMEGFITYYYEYHFLYITGIEHVESKSIQGASLMKLVFHEGTDMNQAMAQVVGYVNRSRAFMPPGAVPPFIVRYDAGSVPVGQLIFSSSAGRSPGEMQNIALNQVRPLFATLSGVSAPPPFGGNQRTLVVRLDPAKLRQYRISPDEAIAAVNRASAVLPSGNVRTGDLTRIASTNASVSANPAELLEAPVRPGSGASVYLRDIATAEIGTDIVTGYAHVNGKRTVYIEVTKRSDASTLDVINRVKQALPAMQAVCPEDVTVSLAFDQSRYVTAALRSLLNEAALSAVLTGLMVILFLRDWRGAVIVILTIPFSLLSAVVWLYATGQSINIMTLGGLALAVGVLVDEATVEIENIESHLAAGVARARAVLDAASKTAVPRLLAMTSILAVFLPGFFMTGAARQLFVPLSLAVGFAMISSYVLSSTLVPVLSVWLMRHGRKRGEGRLIGLYGRYLDAAIRWRWATAALYVLVAGIAFALLVPRLGVELFPLSDSGQFRLRLRAPAGTRIERTELIALKALEVIENAVGKDQVEISTAFIGVQPASYPINTIYLWTSGPQEAVMLVAVKPGARLRGEALQEELRRKLRDAVPQVQASFEAGDIISQVMSFGSPTPIEIAVQGPNMANNRAHAAKVERELRKIPQLRDLAYSQPLDYPALDVRIDRERAGQYGLTSAEVAKSLVAATSSSRFLDPNYWRDPGSGNGFQIQVEIPQHLMASAADVAGLPGMKSGAARPLLGEVAEIREGTAPGAVERYNMQRVVSLTANVHASPLGDVVPAVRAAIQAAGAPPRGSTVAIRGQVPALELTLAELRTGILISTAAMLLLLAAYFQSLRLAILILAPVPAALAGSALVLALTGTTLNVQSFLGAIMAIGIGVANSILLVSFAERSRREGASAADAAANGARGRVRAVLMTAFAMLAGMLPIALGTEQVAPLGRAVLGGLSLATVATLAVLPALYALLQRNARAASPSLDPGDPESRYYEGVQA